MIPLCYLRPDGWKANNIAFTKKKKKKFDFTCHW